LGKIITKNLLIDASKFVDAIGLTTERAKGAVWFFDNLLGGCSQIALKIRID
jgi:hypothetical protein